MCYAKSVWNTVCVGKGVEHDAADSLFFFGTVAFAFVHGEVVADNPFVRPDGNMGAVVAFFDAIGDDGCCTGESNHWFVVVAKQFGTSKGTAGHVAGCVLMDVFFGGSAEKIVKGWHAIGHECFKHGAARSGNTKEPTEGSCTGACGDEYEASWQVVQFGNELLDVVVHCGDFI